METLNINGFEVTTPVRRVKVRKAKPCDLLLRITKENLEKAIKEYRRAGFSGPYDGLRLEGILNFSFLEEFPLLLYLEVDADSPISVDSIMKLHNLRGLHLSSQKQGLDFSAFPELEYFIGDWHIGNSNLESCQLLRELHLHKFNPKSRDLSDIANIQLLDELTIIRGTIESLDGIEKLEDLRTLELAYLPKLADLSSISKLANGIRYIEFDRIPNIESYEPLGHLRRLRQLKISDCASIKNLKWTNDFSFLFFFSFVGTIVADGDLSPLLDLENLKYVGTMDKKSYNMTMEEINGKLKAQKQSDAPNE